MHLLSLAPPGESLASASQRARSAVNFLSELKIPPTPARFTVAYAHQLGEMTDLSLAMNRLIGHDRLSGRALDELFEQFFHDHVDQQELKFASQKVQESVQDVADRLSASLPRYESYGKELGDFTQALSSGDTGKTAAIAADLVEKTKTLVDDHRQLEDRFAFTVRELESMRRHLEQIERDAIRDALTGIGNRAFFNRELRTAMAHARRDSEPLCLLMVDIDHFKQFNDQYGHQMGDQVLKLVARQLSLVSRESNEAARYGGEEFALILRRCDIVIAEEIANRLRKMVASKQVVNRRSGETLGHVTLSIGVGLYRPGEPAAEFVHRADEAMYLAKAQGRNQVVTDEHPDMRVSWIRLI
jgi:diguanylate cyclase